MNKRFQKLIILAAILLLLAGCGPFLARAETTRVTPEEPVNLEVGIAGYKTVTTGIVGYIEQIYKFATAIVGGLAVVMIIIGAVQYSTSAGNKAAMGSAKETITSAIIGLVIVLMAYLILGTFSGSFVNLANPRLEPVNVAEDNTPATGSKHYICGTDTKCREVNTPGSNDPGCSAALVNKPCQAESLPACDKRTLAECARDSSCQVCTTNGTETCKTTMINCGADCQDTCLGDTYRQFCKWDEATCRSNCDPFPPIFNNGVCSGCGEKWWRSRNDAFNNCGRDWQNVEPGPNNQYTCTARYRNEKYEQAQRLCTSNKQSFADSCSRDSCGAPAEVIKNGSPDYCCTNP